MKSVLESSLWTATSILLSVMAPAAAQDRAQQRAAAPPANAVPTLTVIQVRPNFHVIAGAGGNIGVQIGEDGIVVVDAGSAANAPAVIAAIKRISDRPIRYVINTGPDDDHVSGNGPISRAGQSFLDSAAGSARRSGISSDFISGSSIMAVEEVLHRMTAPDGQRKAYPPESWPSETFYESRKSLYLNGEGIEVRRLPAAHTDGDALVYFRRSDVIMAGDVIDHSRFPVIDVARGGSVQGVIDALNRLIEMSVVSVPLVYRDAGTVIVPGHGRLLDQYDLLEYRDMVTIIRDRVQQLIDSGAQLKAVLAAKPARGYTVRYGADQGSWTTDDFVTAVYTSLRGPAQ